MFSRSPIHHISDVCSKKFLNLSHIASLLLRLASASNDCFSSSSMASSASRLSIQSCFSQGNGFIFCFAKSFPGSLVKLYIYFFTICGMIRTAIIINNNIIHKPLQALQRVVPITSASFLQTNNYWISGCIIGLQRLYVSVSSAISSTIKQ